MKNEIQFGTGGFRGVISDGFNKENIQLIAQGLANIIVKRKQTHLPIIVGYDNRFMSDFAARWFAEVLNASGIKTLIFDRVVPTPAVMSVTKDLGNYYGVMITASHNPYYFNGIKIFTKEGYDADESFTTELEKEIRAVKEVNTLSERVARRKGLLENYSDINGYLSHIKSFIDPSISNNKLRVLYNNMNGVGVVGLKPLLEKLHIYQFSIINEDHDAFFGFNLPNPTKSALIGEFSEMVVNQQYNVGLATDSDGDRLGVIDEKGNYVSANEILASIYYYLVKYRGYKGDIVKNCATSELINLVAEHLGYVCHEVDVGFKHITGGIKKHNALLGGESSGGLTMKGYIYGKDASFSGALFLEMLIKLNKPVSKIISDLKEEVGYDMNCTEEYMTIDADPKKALDYMRKHLPELSKKYKHVQIYGRNIKFTFEDRAWVLLRLSGTEPAFRIFTEFKDKKDCQTLTKEVQQYVRDVEKLFLEE